MDVPVHRLELDNPFADGCHDVVVEALVSVYGLVDHIFDELVIHLERLWDLF